MISIVLLSLSFLIWFVVSCIPSLARSWRSFFAIILFAGGFLAYVWVDHNIASSKPGFDPRIPGVMAFALLEMSIVGFASMAIARAVGLLLQRLGRARGSVLWTDALGLVTAVTILISSALHRLF
jgi:hypothetical protein